uniref:Uncharacterized protein n=1 Tax=Opuntia streptacantha TaxID=393608 RepID=A0A7C9E678_OPUST
MIIIQGMVSNVMFMINFSLSRMVKHGGATKYHIIFNSGRQKLQRWLSPKICRRIWQLSSFKSLHKVCLRHSIQGTFLRDSKPFHMPIFLDILMFYTFIKFNLSPILHGMLCISHTTTLQKMLISFIFTIQKPLPLFISLTIPKVHHVPILTLFLNTLSVIQNFNMVTNIISIFHMFISIINIFKMFISIFDISDTFSILNIFRLAILSGTANIMHIIPIVHFTNLISTPNNELTAHVFHLANLLSTPIITGATHIFNLAILISNRSIACLGPIFHSTNILHFLHLISIPSLFCFLSISNLFHLVSIINLVHLVSIINNFHWSNTILAIPIFNIFLIRPLPSKRDLRI